MNVLGTPFYSAWDNFARELASSPVFCGAIILTIVVILYCAYYVRVRRRPWRVGGRPRHDETSPRDEESETEQR